ncbi:MAG: electron transport complex subunit RsxG [Gammaproteobacteria bacterium]|nr:electron transport complex subunit RsxG [Gammaproteobacteria bacterium]
MPNKSPGTITRTSLTLGAFALLAALLLGAVNVLTADRIETQQRLAERNALIEIFPARFHDNDLLEDAIALSPEMTSFTNITLLGLTSERMAYLARHGETPSGIILPLEVHDGYSGDIILLVGILVDGSISGVRVLEHRETPGLGDKIEVRVSDWILGFDERSLVGPALPQWQVIKDGGQFDQLVGATVTPRAIVNGVRKVLEFYESNLQVISNL